KILVLKNWHDESINSILTNNINFNTLTNLMTFNGADNKAAEKAICIYCDVISINGIINNEQTKLFSFTLLQLLNNNNNHTNNNNDNNNNKDNNNNSDNNSISIDNDVIIDEKQCSPQNEISFDQPLISDSSLD
uniref:hypothetical protein n=1 Tax=Salmonella sp. s51228 TaxID=3159652 RepID=UPI0039809090